MFVSCYGKLHVHGAQAGSTGPRRRSSGSRACWSSFGGLFLPRSRRHERRVSMKFLCRRGRCGGNPGRRGGGKRHIARRAGVTWKPCRILMLPAAAARPVVFLPFPRASNHVASAGRGSPREEAAEEGFAQAHVRVANSVYASPCRPSAVVWHLRHGGYVIRRFELRDFLIGQAAEPSGGLPQEASPRDAMHTPSIHEVHRRWQMPMLSSRPGLCPLDLWIIRAADVLLSVRQAGEAAEDEEACVPFQQS